LVGDAAHAMTPNIGAANLAIEDAVEIAAAIGSPPGDVGAGLMRYDHRRRGRTDALRRIARRAGDVAELSAPMAVMLRNACVSLGGRVPPELTAQSLTRVFGWTPPHDPISPPKTCPPSASHD
jgi:2-polyprenyl-6-methoxyphenol hydroxylase-like FAD-dependent oxidoreductase